MTALMPRLWGDLTDWFETDFPSFHPAQLIRVEDQLTDQDYRLRAELPGLEPEKDILVTVANDALTISAERRDEQARGGRSEFRYGMMRRTVRLPANADSEHISARYDKGLLEVVVPLVAGDPTGRTVPVVTKE